MPEHLPRTLCGCDGLATSPLAGLTAGQHLQWATSTRDRFRCWSGTVVPLVHLWLGQYGNNTWLLVQLMTCLTAWVRLGCLYQVPAEVAENTTQAALLCLQSSNEQVKRVSLIQQRARQL